MHQEVVLPYISAINRKLLTIIHLLNGYSFGDLKPLLNQTSFDWISCYDLIRSLYECFLQLNFVANRYKSDNEKLFIARWFHIRFFKERAELAKSNKTINVNHKLQLESEILKIMNLENLIIKDCAELKRREENEFKWKKNSLFNNWPKPEKLYSFANIHENKHRVFYKMHSIYSHSEPLAILQIRSRNKITAKQVNNLNSSHGRQSYLIGLVSFYSLKNVFKGVKVRLEKDKELEMKCLKACEYFSSDTKEDETF
nr:hypothetical protein [Pseudopedobacter sp.]